MSSLPSAIPDTTQKPTSPPPVPYSTGSLISSIHITSPSTPDLIGFPLPSYHSTHFSAVRGQPEFIVIDGVRYSRESARAGTTSSQVESGANSGPRFQRLVEELAGACNISSAPGNSVQTGTGTAATTPEETMGEILKNWNQSKSMDQSGASTPQPAGLDDNEGEEDGSSKIKVTLIYE